MSLYARRMLVLALLGVSHAMLHPSEVLHRYALLGFALVLLRHRSTSVLVGAAAASIAATIAWPGGGDAVEPMVRAAVFADGSLGDVLAFNAATFFRGSWIPGCWNPCLTSWWACCWGVDAFCMTATAIGGSYAAPDGGWGDSVRSCSFPWD